MKTRTDRTPSLLAELAALREAIEREEAKERPHIDAALAKHRTSARNLAHYLGLRRRELRRLQMQLSARGLSSLGRCEGHVRHTLAAISGWLGEDRAGGRAEPLDHARADALLHENTRALFGPRPADRHVYIMVTAPAATEATAGWADQVIGAGTDLLRINGAHESPGEWEAIAKTFKRRAADHGKTVRVFVDLPGPKLRAEITQLEDAVLHFPRRKDRLGRTVEVTRVRLVSKYRGGPQIPVPARWLPELRDGDRLRFTDAAGRARELVVSGRASHDGAGEGVSAECSRSLYVTAGLPLAWMRGRRTVARGRIGTLPRQPRELRLAVGDRFVLNAAGDSGDAALPALAFPEAQLLAQVRAGERVILDDGRITCAVESLVPQGLVCRVQHAVKPATRLRTGKGVAFPDSSFPPSSLSARDEQVLAFALDHADGVGVSFVNSPHDVAVVGERIRRADKPGFGMVLKLETRGALHHLPAILFEALKYDPVGIMIARGDLAVETSFERLAELQEEILWFGEACHLPVIWATEVLDSLAHTGVPTRPEVTDAAMSMRAECVMLNRGPFAAEAARLLADIIRKMEHHQYKKQALYRPLAIAQENSAPGSARGSGSDALP